MSKHKFAVPGTYVLGSSPMLDAKGHRVVGIDHPLHLANGKPHGTNIILASELWNKGQVLGVVSHWANEAARRRNGGDMTKAKASELVQVPHYRGVSCELARMYRFENRKEHRKSVLQRVKEAALKRIKAVKVEAPAAEEAYV